MSYHMSISGVNVVGLQAILIQILQSVPNRAARSHKLTRKTI